MKKEIRDKERKLFLESMELRKLDLTNTNFEQSEKIREKQNDYWRRHLFFKGYLEQLDKQNQKKQEQ